MQSPEPDPVHPPRGLSRRTLLGGLGLTAADDGRRLELAGLAASRPALRPRLHLHR